MTVIVLASNKGGVGKTTLAMNVAQGLSRRGRTLLIDADPQQSALQWSRVAEGVSGHAVNVVAKDRPLAEKLEDARPHHRFLVIDCPPALGAAQTQEALEEADVLLVPMQPSPVDLWAGAHIAEWVRDVKQRNARLQAYIVLNQVEPHTKLWQGVSEVMGELGLPTLTTTVRRRAAFRNAALTGATVYTMGRQGREAARDIDSLITEVVGHEPG